MSGSSGYRSRFRKFQWKFEFSDLMGGTLGFRGKFHLLLLSLRWICYFAAYFLEILDDSVRDIDEPSDLDLGT